MIKPLRMTDDQMKAWLAPVLTAPTIDTLEEAFQQRIWTTDGTTLQMTKKAEQALRDAVEQRGWELVAMDSHGEYIPRIVSKPSSFNGTTYRGQTFRSGTWGNAAGYRWEHSYLEEWVQKIGGFQDRRTADLVVEWVLYGMPHRALQVLLQADQEKQNHERIL